MYGLQYVGNQSRMTVTLGSGYTAGSGTMSLSTGDGAKLPTTGPFWIVTVTGTYRAFKVTAVSGDTLTVTSAQDGTSDGNLSAGQSLEWNLTYSALVQLRNDMTGNSGNSMPDDASFSWLNQGGATVSRANNRVLLVAPASASDNIRGRQVAVPGASYTAILSASIILHSTDYVWAGLYVTDSGSGRLLSVDYTHQIADQIGVTEWTSITAYSAFYFGSLLGYSRVPVSIHLKITDDGTTFTFYYSFDRNNWITLGTKTHAFLASPTSVGFYCNSRNNKEVQLWTDNFQVF